jgi:hypothetical protein
MELCHTILRTHFALFSCHPFAFCDGWKNETQIDGKAARIRFGGILILLLGAVRSESLVSLSRPEGLFEPKVSSPKGRAMGSEGAHEFHEFHHQLVLKP